MFLNLIGFDKNFVTWISLLIHPSWVILYGHSFMASIYMIIMSLSLKDEPWNLKTKFVYSVYVNHDSPF